MNEWTIFVRRLTIASFTAVPTEFVTMYPVNVGLTIPVTYYVVLFFTLFQFISYSNPLTNKQMQLPGIVANVFEIPMRTLACSGAISK